MAYTDTRRAGLPVGRDIMTIVTLNGRSAFRQIFERNSRLLTLLALAALVRIEAARSRGTDPQDSVELWRALVSGRWSVVEHFERDGKRYYLAHKNDPQLAPDLALTERERQVLGYAELGHSDKLIAYSLGLSRSTVATLLARARRKLGPGVALSPAPSAPK